MRIILLFLTAILLMGCSTPTATPQPTPTATPDPLAFIDDLPPDAVLIQLTYHSSPEGFYSLYWEVPQFTLYADGTILYLAENREFPAVMETHFDSQQVREFMDQVMATGIAHTVSFSFDEICEFRDLGTSAPCLTDQTATTLRIQLDADTMHVIDAYADYTSQPGMFDAAKGLLEAFEVEDAVLYAPQESIISFQVVEVSQCSDGDTWPCVPEWPLDTDRLVTEDGYYGEARLNGEESAALAPFYESNIGRTVFETDGGFFEVTLIPVIPGT
jgi:hypothetical protein